MFESGLFPLGVLLFLIGAVFFLVTYGILRVVPKIRPKFRNEKQQSIAPDIANHMDAVLIVKTGGRISYINDEARSWFNLALARQKLGRADAGYDALQRARRLAPDRQRLSDGGGRVLLPGLP